MRLPSPRALAALLALCCAWFLVLPGCAGVTGAAGPQIRDVDYRDGETVLRGHLAVPDGAGGPHPAVLVVHEWWGRGAHSDRSAEELAKLGYIGFAVDMYGGGRSTTNPDEAGAWAKTVRGDPAVLRRRIEAALAVLRAMPEADMTRVACIGYCFGGTVSLEAAWAGFDLRGVVSFHGSLTTPRPEQAAGVKAAILVCHGADDALVPGDTVTAFQASMREHRYDWELDSYGGAVHSFTNPAADGSFNPSVKYDPQAARRSWARMRDFLAERFTGSTP
jgi:dienelactone hydrolase